MIQLNSLGLTDAMDVGLPESIFKIEDLSKSLCKTKLKNDISTWEFAQWCKDFKCNSLGLTRAMDVRLSEIQSRFELEDLSKSLCKTKLKNAITSWEYARWCNDKIPKFIIKYTVLHSFDSHTDAIDFRSIRDFSCYSSLLSYHSSCVSEVKAMRNHEISNDLSLFEFMTKEITTFTKLTERRDISRFEDDVSQKVYDKKYPIYSDLISEMFIKAGWLEKPKLYRRFCSFYEHKFSVMQQHIKWEVETKCIITKSAKTNRTIWEECVFDMEMNRMYDGAEAKSMVRYILLKFFKKREYEDVIDLNMFKNQFYHSVVIFYGNCLLQVKDMESDKIRDSLSVRDIMVDKGLEQNAGISTDNIYLRMEQLFERVISGKYYLYRDIIANKMERSLLMDKILDLHPFKLIGADYEATEKKSDLDSVVVVEVTKYLSSANLLNLVLAFSPSYKNYCFEKHSSFPKRQMDESQGSSKSLKCSD